MTFFFFNFFNYEKIQRGVWTARDLFAATHIYMATIQQTVVVVVYTSCEEANVLPISKRRQ